MGKKWSEVDNGIYFMVLFVVSGGWSTQLFILCVGGARRGGCGWEDRAA